MGNRNAVTACFGQAAGSHGYGAYRNRCACDGGRRIARGKRRDCGKSGSEKGDRDESGKTVQEETGGDSGLKGKPMTLDEFFVNLEKTAKDNYFWVFIELPGREPSDLPVIRSLRYGYYCCPVTAVCLYLTGRNITAMEWSLAASLIGLDNTEANHIVQAADGKGHLGLRKRIREALNLQPLMKGID